MKRSAPSFVETVAETAAAAAAQPDISQLTSTSQPVEEGRFPPGALLGGRELIGGGEEISG